MTDSLQWRPSASQVALKSRAQQLAWVRGFFAQRDVMEVETPVLGRHGVTDINIDSISSKDQHGFNNNSSIFRAGTTY